LPARVRDMDGDKITDMVVTNGGSGTLLCCTAWAKRFFDDRRAECSTTWGTQ